MCIRDRTKTVLPSGKRAKNAHSISLPSLWQYYLVAMATSLDKLENKVQIHHLQIKRFHMVKRLRKCVQYVRRYSTKYACFLAVSYLTFSNKPCHLWSYHAKVHQILDNVAPSSPLLLRTARPWYCNLFSSTNSAFTFGSIGSWSSSFGLRQPPWKSSVYTRPRRSRKRPVSIAVAAFCNWKYCRISSWPRDRPTESLMP